MLLLVKVCSPLLHALKLLIKPFLLLFALLLELLLLFRQPGLLFDQCSDSCDLMTFERALLDLLLMASSLVLDKLQLLLILAPFVF